MRTIALGFTLIAIAAYAPPALAEKRFAAANGVDTMACGAKDSPCRSIGRTIENAAIGDTIEVGPGRYGDLDGDGMFDGTGEEAAEIGGGCDCMIHVDRPLTIVSRDGRGATVLDAAFAPVAVVRIDADGVTFGLKGKGFTLTGSSGDHGLICPGSNATVAGNRFVGNGGNGLDAQAVEGVTTVTDNVAETNGTVGFRLDNSNVKIVQRNVAVPNGNKGFSLGNGDTALVTDNLAVGNADDGFDLDERTTVKGNVALANGGTGFDLDDDSTMTGNVAQGNRRGVELGARSVVTKNSFVGNRGFGIVVRDDGNVVTKNTIFGNDDAGDTTDMLMGTIRFNCGMQSLAATLDASRNFWGAATGPGDDPADAFCQEGLVVAGPVAPVTTKEIKVKPKAAR